MFLTALWMLSVQTSAPLPTHAKPIDPAGWVTSGDYPLDALRANEQGAVAFMLAVSADGVPTECNVTTSSGSPSLDTGTCALLLQRARFTPARDAAGQPTSGVFRSRINWKIPQGGSLVIQVTKSDAGFVCTTEHGGQRHVIKADWCKTWTDTIRGAGGDPLKASTIHGVGDPAEFISRHLQ